MDRLVISSKDLLPALGWLPLYRRDWLLPDILAGLALWAVMVPEGMAYSGIVGVPPNRARRAPDWDFGGFLAVGSLSKTSVWEPGQHWGEPGFG